MPDGCAEHVWFALGSGCRVVNSSCYLRAGSENFGGCGVFGEVGVSAAGVDELLKRGTPIIPIATEPGTISAELPDRLKVFNCLTFSGDGPMRIGTALLECLGLLPRQRRVFVSYRRDEAKESALQLFNFLSSKIFDVFLDTHGILPAEDFQGVLWHRLCDSDVLIMPGVSTASV